MSEYSEALEELVSSGVTPDNETNKVAEKSTDDLIIDEMERITAIKFSEEQRQCLRHHGSGVILACAGSGKTSVLANLIAKRIWNREILDTNRVICTTYSKAGADEMNDRLHSLLDRLGIKCNLEIRTLHSFFYSLIRTFGMNNFKIISDGIRMQYIKEACKEAGFICKDDDLMVISNLISYRVNNLLNDNATLSSPACTINDITVAQFSEIRKGYDLRKSQNNYIDFDDMQLYLYKWVCKDIKSQDENVRNTGNAVRNYCRAIYDEFYIDEAQDVSKIQFEIVKSIVTDINTGRLDKMLIFMGDDDQCIYKWRGAAPEIILTLGATMNIGNFILSSNYRCKSEVVDFAHRSIVNNSSRFDKEMKAYNQGGQVEIYQALSMDLYDLSKIAYEKIKELLNSGEKKSDIAVLCRNNAQLSILNNMLIELGIYCNIPDEMKLTKTYIYTDIKNVMTVADNTFNWRVTAQTMWKLCEKMTAALSRQIGSFQEENGLDLLNTLKYIVNNIVAGEEQDKISINRKSESKLQYALIKAKSETIAGIVNLISILEIEDRAERVNKMIAIYRINTEYLYKNEDKNRTLQGIIHYIQNTVGSKGIEETLKYLRTVEQLENSSFKPPKDTIKMTTIHSAKGKEWKNVILFACDDESMPGMSGIRKMMENMSIADIDGIIDEERRLYYVGCTRAKERLEIITGIHPSVFLLESVGLFDGLNGEHNAAIIDIAENGNKALKVDTGIVKNKDIEDRLENKTATV